MNTKDTGHHRPCDLDDHQISWFAFIWDH